MPLEKEFRHHLASLYREKMVRQWIIKMVLNGISGILNSRGDQNMLLLGIHLGSLAGITGVCSFVSYNIRRPVIWLEINLAIGFSLLCITYNGLTAAAQCDALSSTGDRANYYFRSSNFYDVSASLFS